MPDLKTLQTQAKDYTILFVEDSDTQQQQMRAFLGKFFGTVHTERDGAKGLETFRKEHPDIVVTDIEMPDMNGLEMVRNIKAIDQEVPVIIMSAFDEKEYLLDAIRYGVIHYIKKPAHATELAETLSKTLQALKTRRDRNIFVSYLQHVFDYQNNMILLLEKTRALVANPIFLDFFGARDVQEFNETVGDIGSRFDPLGGFLSNEREHWLEQVLRDPGRHYHVKMSGSGDGPDAHHFLLSYRHIPKKEHYGLLLLDDITDLDLLDLFINRPERANTIAVSTETINSVLRLIKEHRLEIKIHNFYKGLSITNPATIVEGDADRIYIKTSSHQLRASRYEKSLVISSDALPHFIYCEEIVSVDYDQGMIVARGIQFMKTSPTQRRDIRVVPPPDHNVALRYKEHLYDDSNLICDLSINAVKIEMIAIPAGIRNEDPLSLSMGFTLPSGQRLEIETPATVIRTSEHNAHYHLVAGYDLLPDQRRELVDMIAKRQMELIREFKRLQ